MTAAEIIDSKHCKTIVNRTALSNILERRIHIMIEEKIAVLSPLGQPPPVQTLPLAPRPGNLDGKTVYIVCSGFCQPSLPELHRLLAERYPETNWKYVDKIGSYFDDDPRLWAEIKEKGDAVIIGIGH
jgi:hypothetical protein